MISTRSLCFGRFFLVFFICLFHMSYSAKDEKKVSKEESKAIEVSTTMETLKEEIKEIKETLEKMDKAEEELMLEEEKAATENNSEFKAALEEELEKVRLEKEFATELYNEENKNDEKSSKDETNEEEREETEKSKDSERKEESDRSGLPLLEKAEEPAEQVAPKDTFAVWNHKGKICLLAKFSAVFAIKYASSGGEQKAEINVPETAEAKGNCDSSQGTPILQVSWQKYELTLIFNKSDDENSVVTSMELAYDTTEPLFDGAANAGKKKAISKPLSIFETPLDKSYFCPAQEVVLLHRDGKQVVTARMKNTYLQAYQVEEGKFSPIHRCSKVVIDGPDVPFVQDETVPLAVGCTLALITLIILVGFSIHRALNAAKVDYNAVP